MRRGSRDRCWALALVAFPALAAVALVLAPLASCTAGGPTVADHRRTGAPSGGPTWSVRDIVRRVAPSVVTILSGDRRGSGVVYRADGVIVGNAHILGRARNAQVAFADGTQVTGAVVGSDTVSDVAVVRVARSRLSPAVFQPVPPRRGERVLAIGGSFDLHDGVTEGTVSADGQRLPGLASPYPTVDLVLTDAVISPVSSGGALVNGRGEVVGLNETYLPPRVRAVSLGFAIPAAAVIDATNQLLTTGVDGHGSGRR